ncbi:MAG: hypothetical protein GXP27_11525 [Planctomycetes bacterium]|nr:hypothetical protein [Planctomycetota bacterium]
MTRRAFLERAAAGWAAASLAGKVSALRAQPPGQRPRQDDCVQVLNPQNRVPLSFIIDDSTVLVNLAYFGIPQFAEVFPKRYKQDWRKLPREIPDDFVRKFHDWCAEQGVKGKYSIVPCPALVGWVDRLLPGWTRRELEESLKLVRELVVPNWDIHPEMITHTWVIDTRTGRPYEPRTADYMENWGWSVGKSADELAEYMAYALRILKNVGLPCEGITTPGGFGNRSREALAQGTLQACRDVYGTEIPHYFRHLFTDERSVAPRVEYASGLGTDDPRCVVSIIGCTGDWFGGWDGLTPGSVDRFITPDLNGGRLPYVIGKGEPAILVCHWPGIYFNGEEIGFKIFKEVVRRLHSRYDNLIWMKLSEIARYWAARQLTQMTADGRRIVFDAPYHCPAFTVRITGPQAGNATTPPTLVVAGRTVRFQPVSSPLRLEPNTCCFEDGAVIACFDLPKGRSVLQFIPAPT